MSVSKVYTTPDAERQIVILARVSSSRTDKTADHETLIKYLIDHSHWSPFEHAFMTVKIRTSRAMSAQLLRHRSFTFQEFSQRYAPVQDIEPIQLRKQSHSQRQSSTEPFYPEIDGVNASVLVDNHMQLSLTLYRKLLDAGVARETARMILPMAATTKIFMTGSLRSWIHFLETRTAPEAQQEMRRIALQIRAIFRKEFPIVAASVRM